VEVKRRWNFFRTVLHENIELIFGPAITILPQLFCLPQIIFASTMACRDFSSTVIRYSFILSFFVSFTPQVISFLLYVRSSSVYYARFRSTSLGKKMMSYWNGCRKLKQQSNNSEISRYAFANTTKFETNIWAENTRL
jgi:hypothetical protein